MRSSLPYQSSIDPRAHHYARAIDLIPPQKQGERNFVSALATRANMKTAANKRPGFAASSMGRSTAVATSN